MSKRKIKEVKSFREDFVLHSLHDEELSKTRNPAMRRIYNEDGQIVLEEIFGNQGQLAEKYTYKYQDKLLIEKCTWFDLEEIAETETYIYQGEKLDYIIKDYSEGYSEKIVLTYDDQGRLIKKEAEDGEGERTLISYNGLEKTVQSYDDFNVHFLTEIIRYNDKEDEIYKKTIYLQDELEEEMEFGYNADGQLIKEVIKRNGKWEKTVETTYNQEGLPITIISTSNDEESKIELEHDEKGNETKQIEWISGKLGHQVERKYNDVGELTETHVEIHGNGQDQSMIYSIYYSYQYFD